MPTNLPPEYYKVEKRFKEAETITEKIATLEELISTVPHHKGTDHLLADLRRRLAKLRDQSQRSKGAGRQESVFQIEKEGCGRVVLVGPPNAGRSSLVAALTHAKPEVTPAPFSTWVPTPGMLEFEDVQIQLIDTPSLNREHVEPELYNLIRTADLLLLMIDLQASPDEQLEESLDLLREKRIAPACQPSEDPAEKFYYLPLIVLVNKHDGEQFAEDFQIFRELAATACPLLPISTTTGYNLEELKRTLFEALEIMRVYSKPPNKDPDMSRPFVLPKGGNVEDFAGQVHRDFVDNLKSARVWGAEVFDGQPVGRDHVLHDGDVVELHI